MYLLFLWLAIALPLASATCVHPQPLTRSFCHNPPVVPSLSLTAYTGRWYQIYVSGMAADTTRFPRNCVTANYTILPDSTIDVKNCFFIAGNTTIPRCIQGVAKRRPGGTEAQLQVGFVPGVPMGSYNVAAIVGRPNWGYAAAAVYSCEDIGGVLQESLFLIARVPFMERALRQKLLEQMRCRGYEIRDPLERGRNGGRCRYFDRVGFELGSFGNMGMS